MSKTSLASFVTSLLLATSGAQAHGPAVFSATLLGSNEVGTPGDPDGFGTASAVIDAHTGQVDWSFTFENLGTVRFAHIHVGAAGTNGPIIVNFPVPTGLSGSGPHQHGMSALTGKARLDHIGCSSSARSSSAGSSSAGSSSASGRHGEQSFQGPGFNGSVIHRREQDSGIRRNTRQAALQRRKLAVFMPLIENHLR